MFYELDCGFLVSSSSSEKQFVCNPVTPEMNTIRKFMLLHSISTRCMQDTLSTLKDETQFVMHATTFHNVDKDRAT